MCDVSHHPFRKTVCLTSLQNRSCAPFLSCYQKEPLNNVLVMVIHTISQWRHMGVMASHITDNLIVYSPVNRGKWQRKNNIKVPHYWSGDRRSPFRKGQWCGKRFHIMMPSWNKMKIKNRLMSQRVTFVQGPLWLNMPIRLYLSKRYILCN